MLLALVGVALAISHFASLITNYIGNGEYKKSNLSLLMGQPYGRVVVLHLTIICGGFLIAIFGSPIAGMVLLILLKMFIDLKAHLGQHHTKDTSGPQKVLIAKF